MTKNGVINFKIKQKDLRAAYLSAVKQTGLSESEFIRLSIRHMISCVQETGEIPAIKSEVAK